MVEEPIPVEMEAKILEFLQRYNREAVQELQKKAELRDSSEELEANTDLPQHTHGSRREPSVLLISLSELSRYDRDLFDDVVTHPEKLRTEIEDIAINYAALTEEHVHELETDVNLRVASRDLPEDTVVQFTDPPSFIKRSIGEPITDEDRGSLIVVEGLCQQLSDPKPRIIKAVFDCQRCGNTSDPVPVDHTFDLSKVEPHQCIQCERQGPFRRNKRREKTELYQQLRLQEPPENAENAANPREIVCDAQGRHLMDVIQPGDRVTVVGVVTEDEDSDSTLRSHRLDVDAIIPEQQQFEDVELDETEKEQIEELAGDDAVYEHLKKSIAPTIYGYPKVKLAVALQLFGGVTRRPYDDRKRGDIHIFLLGDPGVGKTQILESARRVAPRGVKATGTGSTAVGLTASAQKEKIGNEEEWTLQAGSLVLADGGIITIDELDNLRENQQSALDEALSEGKIQVDKANVHATLNARCAALMAANPEEGRFDMYEAIADQFDMPPELMNRCDLVFPFVDTPDEEKDEKIIDTILDAHSDSVSSAAADGGATMAVDENGVIKPDIFRKYVALARREVEPELTETARERLKDYYLEIRENLSGEEDGYQRIAINTRQFEGLIRLAEASARVRLSDEATEEDADRAIELLQTTLNKLGRDPETGKFDVDIMESGRSRNQQTKINELRTAINELDSENDYKGAPREELKNWAAENGYEEDWVEYQVDDGPLREKGEIYENSKDHYKTT